MRTSASPTFSPTQAPSPAVHIDVSRDSENADQQVELQARGVCEQLAEQALRTR
jgi:hypothetical protein